MTVLWPNDAGFESFQPGYRPRVRVADKVAYDELMTFQRQGWRGLSAAKAAELKGKAFEYITDNGGRVQIQRHDGLVAYSILLKDEWEEIDSVTLAAGRERSIAVADLRSAGLTRPLSDLGTMVSQYAISSKKERPVVSMSGRAATERDRLDRDIKSVPVPIIHQESELGMRELLASRRGDALDTSEAAESARVVAEESERILLGGSTGIEVGGDTIYGYSNHPNRLTDTATNLGGGDFGTQGNGPKSLHGALSALNADFYYGPFGVYVARTQFYQTQTPIATRAGSDLMDMRATDGVQFVKQWDFMTAGEMIVVQLTSDVVDLATALSLTTRTWDADDGMASYIKVMLSEVPRIKVKYGTKVGVMHVTGC